MPLGVVPAVGQQPELMDVEAVIPWGHALQIDYYLNTERSGVKSDRLSGGFFTVDTGGEAV